MNAPWVPVEVEPLIGWPALPNVVPMVVNASRAVDRGAALQTP